MKKISKILQAIIVVLFVLIPLSQFASAFAQESNVVIVEVLERPDCLHCQDERAFFEDLKSKRSDFEIRYHNIYEEEGKNLWVKLTEVDKISKVTPITLIGNTVVQGFDKPETTGKRFEELINGSVGKQNLTLEEYIVSGGEKNVETSLGVCTDPNVPCEVPADKTFLIDVPFVGVVNVRDYSLPVLSSLLGFIDGFNPCAMWVLVTFLIILIKVGDRKKILVFAGVFIIAETIMYHLILSVWFTAWDFVGLNNIVTPIVGLVAMGGGIFFLYEWKTSDGTCKIINPNKRKKTIDKIKHLVESKFTLFTVFGILTLAFSVNIIEFACSIGIPQAFTKIIELNDLTFWQSEMYMLIYIFFYMIDDFIVFAIALYSFDKISTTSKYSKISNLVGGIIMIILGLLLIFKPELLEFY